MVFKKNKKADKKQIVDEFLSVQEPDEDVASPNIDTEMEAENLQCDVVGDIELAKKVIAKLTTVYDPEIPVNIYDLGLIYKLEICEDKSVNITMTLTAPGCPVAHLFPGMVEDAAKLVDEISDAHVEIVWDPPWTQDRMSEAAKLELGMF